MTATLHRRTGFEIELMAPPGHSRRSLARELAANDWHERSQDRRGDVGSRNVELLVADPR